MAEDKKEYRVISSTHDQDLADGRVVGPGGSAFLSQEEVADPHNQNLIQGGLLVEAPQEQGVEPTEAAKRTASELGVNLEDVEATGADGKVTVTDVKNFAADRDDTSEKEGS